MENVTPVVRSDIAPRFLQWSPIVLGAFAATALSSVLLTFAVTIGLGVTSAAPTWRDTSAALALLSGLYLIIQAVLSFGLGGYIAGHARTPTGAAAVEELKQVALVRLIPGDLHRWNRAQVQTLDERGVE